MLLEIHNRAFKMKYIALLSTLSLKQHLRICISRKKNLDSISTEHSALLSHITKVVSCLALG